MSAEIISLEYRRKRADDVKHLRVRAAREAYIKAKRAAEASLLLEDGIVSGERFAEFVSALADIGVRADERHALYPTSISIGQSAREMAALLRSSNRGGN